MSAPRNRPILVTGPHRSGSTWVGRMIASHPRVRYFAEPFNPDTPDCPVHHYFHATTQDDEPRFEKYLRYAFELRYAWRTQGGPACRAAAIYQAARWAVLRWLGYRPLIKDPMALFSAEWLAHHYQPDMIVLTRHPAAFASSLKRLNWFFPFGDLLGQTRLMEDYLEPFRPDIERYSRQPPDIITQAILLWRILHYRIMQYRLKHPDWIFVRHEDLSARPQEGFGKLFAAIGLGITASVWRTIDDHTGRDNPAEADAGVVHQLKRDSAGNIWNWRQRLQPDEIRRIRKGTDDIARHFYADADWRPAQAIRAAA